jgi:ABC-2 type transport system ATP-binding protein
MLTIEHLSKRYGKKQALHPLSFTVHPHQIMGVFGPNGCGKSTLFRLIMGIVEPSTGSISHQGQPIESVRHRFGYMPEQRALMLDLTVRDHAQFIGKLNRQSAINLIHRIDDLAHQLHLSAALDHPIRHLSKGNQQKVQLMMTLLNDPTVLILDEPFNGLDVSAREELATTLRRLAQRGTAILISSHLVDTVSDLCDSILVLSEGRVQRQGHLSAFRSQQNTIRITVNADSNWKDLPVHAQRVSAQGHRVLFEFDSISKAKQAMRYFNADRSVQTLQYEGMGLRTLIDS